MTVKQLQEFDSAALLRSKRSPVPCRSELHSLSPLGCLCCVGRSSAGCLPATAGPGVQRRANKTHICPTVGKVGPPHIVVVDCIMSARAGGAGCTARPKPEFGRALIMSPHPIS